MNHGFGQGAGNSVWRNATFDVFNEEPFVRHLDTQRNRYPQYSTTKIGEPFVGPETYSEESRQFDLSQTEHHYPYQQGETSCTESYGDRSTSKRAVN